MLEFRHFRSVTYSELPYPVPRFGENGAGYLNRTGDLRFTNLRVLTFSNLLNITHIGFN